MGLFCLHFYAEVFESDKKRILDTISALKFIGRGYNNLGMFWMLFKYVRKHAWWRPHMPCNEEGLRLLMVY